MLTEKKTINYKGMELPCIESGYWPDGVTMLCGAGYAVNNVVCLQAGRVITKVGTTSRAGEVWAILPPKPAPRRLTNREVAKLCRAGWDACVCGTVSSAPEYSIHDENDYVEDTSLRAPNSDEWLEPTSDLLEVGE